MTNPWFDPNAFAWVPGTIFGVTAVILGGFAAWLTPQGRAKQTIVSAWVTLWATAIALLVIGLIALLNSQPFGVWYGLLLPGAVGTAVLGGNLFVILKRYRQAEQSGLCAVNSI